MISWLIVIIISYLFFSFSFFGDKLILNNKSNAALYAFSIGMLSILMVIAIPFIQFRLPDSSSVLWIALDGVVYILALYTMFLALEKYEVSRVTPTIGAMQPILILLLAWFFWGPQVITKTNMLAFGLLILGSVLISIEKKFAITRNYVLLLFFSALLFSLDYVFSKMIFLNQPFLQGLIWMRISSFVVALVFLFSKDIRSQIFSFFHSFKNKKKAAANKKNEVLFLFTQSAGGIAGVLQSFAISLVPISYLAIANSLRGTQYVFLFLITLFFSFFFPKIFKEDISRRAIIQKVIAILIIVLGLGMLVF